MDVFISHSANTTEAAAGLAEALRERGYSTWLDASSKKPGDNWKDEIEKAIEKAPVIIFLFEPRQEFGPWQRFEWSKALEAVWTKRNKKLVPVLIGDAEPPSFLKNWQHVRVKKKAPNWDRTAESVITLLRDGISRGGVNEGSDKDDWAQWLSRLRELEHMAKALKNTEKQFTG